MIVAGIGTVIEVAVVVVLALLALLFAGGYIANARRREAQASELHTQIEAADAALADARAGDRGWDREAIEAVAREAFSARHPGRTVRELHLVQVVDRPGTDADEALLRVVAADGGEETVRLGRRQGAWQAADQPA